MDLDMGKRRSLIAGLAVLGLAALIFFAVVTGMAAPVAQWLHDSATATLPINNPEYMYNRALEYEQDGNSVYAQAAARRAVMIKPDYAEARKFLAAKDLRNKDFTDAAAQCKGLLTNNPNDSTALLGLASAYGGLGETAKSEDIYRKVMENTVNTEVVRDAAQKSLGALEHQPGAAAAPGSRSQIP